MITEAPTIQLTKEAPEVVGLIQGQMPGSINEWYVSLALERLQLDYYYQYQIYGGRGIRGGIVVDFVVYAPSAVPVEILGTYWHSARQAPEDQLKWAAEEHYFRTKPILLSEEETDTADKALQAVRTKVLR